MANLAKLTHIQYPVPLAIAGGVVISLLAGTLIGSGDLGTIKRLVLIVFVVAYVLFLHSYTWKIALLICMLGFTHVGFGFKIGGVEMTGLLSAATIVAVGWRKQRLQTPEVMELYCFRVFRLALLAWLLYSSAHAVYTVMDPFNPYEFALKNFSKTVVGMTGLWILVYYFMYRPRGIVSDENMLKSVVTIGAVGLVVNIAIRTWGILHGIHNPEVALDLGDDARYFTIPGVDLMEDPYALRGATPFTATVAAVLLGSKWLNGYSSAFRFLVGCVLFLSFLGAVLSGGRATIIFVFFVIGITLWMRAYYRLVLVALTAALFAVLALNLIPGVLRSVPEVMQRSLQMVVFTDESSWAQANINESSRWRRELVTRAFNEWRSDRRIFWFGRGTYKFGNDDLIAQKRNLGEGSMEVSLRRGSTHSLITDLLIVYGLCGLLVYVAMMLSLLWFLRKVYRHNSIDEVGKMVALVCYIQIGFNFAYDLIGGGTTPAQVIWLLIALFGYFYYLERKKEGAVGPGSKRVLGPLPNDDKMRVPTGPTLPNRKRGSYSATPAMKRSFTR